MQRNLCGLRETKFSGGEEMSFEGYGAVFGNVDSYGDVIEGGAFSETLGAARKSGRWPSMLLQHGGWGMGAEDMTPIGVWTDMAEDGKGLWVQGKLAPTPRGQEAYQLLKMSPRPALDGLSIGYVPKEWTAGTKPGEPRRTLKKIDLMEISLVTFPANPKARIVGVKASALTDRELERVLVRDAGFSRSEAVALMRGGAPALKAMRDAGDDAAIADPETVTALRGLLETFTK